jgi:hypothetical protein
MTAGGDIEPTVRGSPPTSSGQLSAQAVLGKPLSEAIGDTACRRLLGIWFIEENGLGESQAVIKAKGHSFVLHAYQSGRHLCVDLV